MIIFKKLTYKNFLSVGDNGITIDLERSPTTLITGKNGDGKSTLLDAITFSLFGKSYRGINKPGLINSVNQKNCVTEIEFEVTDIKNGSFRVVRGIKPNVFEIYQNGKLLNTEASAIDQQRYLEKTIMKTHFSAFCQVVMIGSASYVPFMQLKPAQRREVVETLLDISVFTSMSKNLKGRLSALKEDHSELKQKAMLLSQKIDSQKELIKKLASKDTSQLDVLNKEMSAVVEKAKIKVKEMKELSEKIDQYNEDFTSINLVKKYNKQTKLGEELSEIVVISKTKEGTKTLLDTQSECPTCTQNISNEFKDLKIVELKNDIKELDNKKATIQSEISDLLSEIRNAEKIKDKITNNKETLKTTKASLKTLRERYSELENHIKQLNSDIKSEMDSEKKTLVQLEANLKQTNESVEELAKKIQVHMKVAAVLKDNGIKASVTKKYMPVINREVNKFLQGLNFNIQFELDETFNEHLKSRYKNEFTYKNFSMGERQRLDIALLFAWRSVAAMKNALNTNLLIFDEVADSSLDENGIEDLFAIMDQESSQRQTNIFFISHRENVQDKFRSHIRIGKKSGFTQILV